MAQSVALTSFSLPELLFVLISKEKSDGARSTLELPDSPLVGAASVLTLLLDLGAAKFISIRLQKNFILPDKQIIVLPDPAAKDGNEVLDLMLDGLRKQKHDHSIEQWADHWCGNTWKELLFPERPTIVLRQQIIQRLVNQGILVQSGEKEASTFSLSESGAHLKEELQRRISEAISASDASAFTGKQMTDPSFRPLLIGYFYPVELVRFCDPAASKEDLKTAVNKLHDLLADLIGTDDPAGVLSEDMKTMIPEAMDYFEGVD